MFLFFWASSTTTSLNSFVAYFTCTANIFCDPAPSLKATFWNWGPNTILLNVASDVLYFPFLECSPYDLTIHSCISYPILT